MALISMSSSALVFLLASLVSLTTSYSSPPSQASSSASLIRTVCVGKRNHIDFELCVKVLESDPHTKHAKNMMRLGFGIMKAGFRNSTKTKSYLEKLIGNPKLKSGDKEAVRTCFESYHLIVITFVNAVSEIKEHDDTVTYDLLIAGTDTVNSCATALKEHRFDDPKIMMGIKFTKLFAFVGYEAAELLTS